MNENQVIALLQEHKNERGIARWKRLASNDLESFGVGLTQLRKLAKQVGRDHELAAELWKSDVYEARVLGALIDEPKQMTREQAETQVEDLEHGMLAHVYCSCDAALAKTSFARELAVDWMDSPDAMRRRCGYLLLYELGKNRRDPLLDDAFFLRYIGRIAEGIASEDNGVKDAMNGSLLSVGKRNRTLNAAVIEAAEAMGPVEIEYGATGCQPLDVLKHMTNERLQEKLAG